MNHGCSRKWKADPAVPTMNCTDLCHRESAVTDSPLATEGVDIANGHMALDIGPKTIKVCMATIKKCKACMWNGPTVSLKQSATPSAPWPWWVPWATCQKTGVVPIVDGGN